MADITSYSFSFKELAEILIKKQNIHEGHWSVSLRFGIQGANIALGDGSDFAPTAIVPVMEIGIQKLSEPNPMTVDAAIVNPEVKSKEKGK